MNSKKSLSSSNSASSALIAVALFSLLGLSACKAESNAPAVNQRAAASPSPVPTSTPTGADTGLPIEIRAELDDTHPGWKLFPGDKFCESKPFVSGKFNEDDAVDYAVMFKQEGRGFVVAFLSDGGDYQSQVLEKMSAKEINTFFLTSAKKGDEYPQIVDEDLDRTTRTLRYDAPAGGMCESSAFLWIYRKGTFKKAFVSD